MFQTDTRLGMIDAKYHTGKNELRRITRIKHHQNITLQLEGHLLERIPPTTPNQSNPNTVIPQPPTLSAWDVLQPPKPLMVIGPNLTAFMSNRMQYEVQNQTDPREHSRGRAAQNLINLSQSHVHRQRDCDYRNSPSVAMDTGN